jgi:chemotaxis regulatin CheY-phosphate phosphatase CheZ
MANSTVPVPDAAELASTPENGLLGQCMKAIAGLVPALDNIKASIEESSSKIPKASNQLKNVTQATETATVEILNVLDGMSQKVQAAEEGLKKVRTSVESLPDLGPNVLPEIDAITSALGETRDSSMSIAMALQVQDITSQQIASVTHMIESVRLELLRILYHFGAEKLAGAEPSAQGPKHFDTDAKYTPLGERQEQADLIIQQWTSKQL